ncbi:MAG: DNA translocase FtsK 4TM domain-containing protein, partial [Bacteroidia bacterium]|nr:DNA translocase FtsK 4TM domain-containing protein [Bacteroidia bacterium]
MAKKSKPKRDPKSTKEELTKEELSKRDQKLRVLGLFLLLFGLFLLFSFLSWFQSWKADYNFADTIFKHFSFQYFFDKSIPVENWMGKTGAITSYLFITKWFGVSALFIVLILIVTGIKLFFHYALIPLSRSAKYSFFGILWFPVFFALLFPSNDILGGVYGYQMNLWLMEYLGISGLILLLIFTGLSFTILTFNIPFRWIHASKTRKGDGALSDEKTGSASVPEVELPVNALKEEVQEPAPVDDGFLPTTPHADIELQIEHPTGETDEPSGDGEHYGIDTLYDPTLELKNYKFPPLSLLSEYGRETLNVNKNELEANKNRIVETLSSYDIRIQKIKATIGPAVTLYEIVPEAGIRISRIKNLEDDIALGLAALGIRIIAPIPGRGTIGIEVPNQNPEIVSIKSLLASEKFKSSQFELPFVLGKTISNETFIADLTRMPHLLMAGATGQGKSVGLNAIITSFLYKKHPATVKFVLIDPKKVELTLYSKIERHYLAKLPDSEEAIITDTKKVIRTLNSLNLEMDARYDLLRDAQVRNVKEYNEKFLKRKLNPNDGHKFLPYIVLIIDEFADLIMTAGREIETPLTRLAQLARATGIHLIIATQRPSVNIITGTIKANFPARIAFRVISKIDSRTILDSSGADQLIGRGDMLLSTGSDLIRLQCAFVDTPEVDKVTEYIGSQRGYPDAFNLPEYY